LTYDNICKYLAEEYPAQFVRWLLPSETSDIEVLKTELSLEPIRADSLTFLRTANLILHLEFQTQPRSEPPLPLRMLDYWVRLHRQYRLRVEQIAIFLQETTSETAFSDRFVADNTIHRYRIIRMWEQDPAPLLADPALLPLAPLAQTNSPRDLLQQVAAQIATIEESGRQQNVSACTQVLAGLRFERELIRQLFRRDIMRESVIYQEILEEGLQEGLQQGLQQGEAALILRLLNRKFNLLAPELQTKIQQLPIPQLEALAEALLDFSTLDDLTNWFSDRNL
jgi:predicted transposase/invertase (TIGR01784 family)